MSRPAEHGYRAYGLRIRSAVALPFDSPPGSAASEPDVVVRLGGVPATLPAGGGEPIRIARWQDVPVARVTRPRHPFLLEALAERIETHLHAAGPGAEGAGRRGRVPRAR